MTRRLLSTTALAGLMIFTASPVFAACDNNTPGAGATVTCTGSDTIGVNGSTQAGVTVNVAAGADVHPAVGATDGILIGDGNINVGAGANVQSNAGNAIHANGAGLTTVIIGNGATVNGGNFGILMDGAGDITFGAGSTITGNVRTNALSAAQASIVRVNDTANIGGNIIAGGNANDEFHWIDNTGGNFDTNDIGTSYTGFDKFYKEGNTTTTLTNNNAQDWWITQGTLVATLNNIDEADIASGAILRFNAQSGTYSGDLSGAGTFNILNGSILTLNGTNTGFTGTLDININNNVTLANANALGNTSQININQSTLTYGTSMTNAANVTIGANDATFDTGANNVTMSGNIGGATGRLVKAGTGTLTLSGTNNYGDGTYIAGGTVSVAAASNLGTGGITLDGGNLATTGTLTNTNAIAMNSAGSINTATGTTLTQNGAIGGSGALTKAGAGTLIMGAANSNTGLVNINAGTIEVGAANHLGNGGGGNNLSIDGGTLHVTTGFAQGRSIALGAGDATINIDVGQTLTQNGALSGAGDLNKTGSGLLILNTTGTNSGAVNIAGGTVRVGGSDRLGDGSGTNTVALSNGGVLSAAGTFTNARAISIAASDGGIEVTGASVLTQSGSISGTGDLTKTGTGTLVMTGNNSGFTGATILNAGTIAVSDMDDLGTAVGGNYVDFGGGTLRFDAAFDFARGAVFTGAGTVNTNGNDIEISGDLDGAGTFTKSGTGVLSLTGDNSNSGNLVINAGTLEFDELNDRTFGGDISGAGDLRKAGATSLNLTGNNTMTGAVTVSGGTLRVNGTLDDISSLTVGNTATLGGNGTVADATISSGGTLAPGNSIGTLNVNGTLDFAAGSHYAVEYDANGADNTIATGAITINGGAILDLTGSGGAGTFSTTQTYTILQGSSVTGTFGTINNNLAFLDAVQNNTGTLLQITLERNDIDFADVAEDEDQAGVADAITELDAGNPIFDAFAGLTTEQARDAMNSLSGEHNAGVTGAMAESAGMIQSTLTSHMVGINHNNSTGDKQALAPSSQDQTVYVAALMEPASGNVVIDPARFWVEGIGSIGQSDSHKTAPQQDRHSYGLLGGVDIPFNDGGAWGIFGGYERGEVETDSQRASTDLNNYHLGAFATRPLDGDIHISGGVGATYHDINSVRYVVFPGFQGAPEGDTKGYTASGFVEVSKAKQLEELSVESFFNAGVTHSHMDGYTETNGNGAELVVGSVSKTTPSTQIGLRAGKSIQLDEDTNINVNASIAWQHNFGDLDNENTMRFAAGTLTFDANGPARTRDAAVIGLGVNANVGDGMNAYAAYSGTLSGRAQGHGFKAGLKWDF
ncbi:MAG TPA: autotransporter domain-containing protein [Alphaproteobacteria bacterium]